MVKSQTYSYRGSPILAYLPDDVNFKTPRSDTEMHSNTLWRAFAEKFRAGSLSRPNQIGKWVNSCLSAIETDRIGILTVFGSSNFEDLQPIGEMFRELLCKEYSTAVQQYSLVPTFQICLVPFVSFLSHKNIVSSNLHEQASVIIGMAATWLPVFLPNYLEKVDECLHAKSTGFTNEILKQILSNNPEARLPILLSQVFMTILRIIFEILTFFPKKVHDDCIFSAVETLDRQIQELVILEDTFAVTLIKKEFARLLSMVSKARDTLHLGSFLEQKRNDTREEQRAINVINAWNVINFQGGLAAPGGQTPCHDNDLADFSYIRILPTHQEIISEKQPSLPGNFQNIEAAHWLPFGPRRLIDTNFRLLREDFLRPLRENINGYLKFRMEQEKKQKKRQAIQDGGLHGSIGTSESGDGPQTDITIYTGIKITGFQVSKGKNKQLSVGISFDMPEFLKSKTVSQRKEFWKMTSRLMLGGLVGLIFHEVSLTEMASFSIVLGVIMDRKEADIENGDCEILVHVPEQSLTQRSLRMFGLLAGRKNATNVDGVLMEANKIMFESYRPVLSSLQQLIPETLPFTKYICPPHGAVVTAVDPPLYAETPHFAFDLSKLCNARSDKLLFYPSQKATWDNVVAKLVQSSTLDVDQAKAVVSGLGSEVSCIQGPPGTGKSFVGVQIVKALLENKAMVSPNEPILLVCFTNHALDQFVEHLLDAGYTKIVRIGGRSQVKRIQALSLQNLSASSIEKRSKAIVAKTYRLLDRCGQRLNTLNARMLSDSVHWSDIMNILMIFNSEHYDAFERLIEVITPDVGFEKQRGSQKSDIEDPFAFWLRNQSLAGGGYPNSESDELEHQDNVYSILDPDYGNTHSAPSSAKTKFERKGPLSEEELVKCPDIWSLKLEEKLHLLSIWKQHVPKCDLMEVQALHNEISIYNERLEGFYKEAEASILTKLDIIAVTTTGAAKYKRLLESVSSKIIIAEEAGEILEAHILACLHPDVQHLILIGDHKQLRPKAACYELSSESKQGSRYRLDISLFERLQEGKFPLSSLLTQRRMRPEIADFIRHCIYPNLKDAPNVMEYADIHGVRSNTFFVTHNHPEDRSQDSERTNSATNSFEVNYVIGLIKYLLRQNYRPVDLVILTPYVGQLLKLRNALKKEVMVFVSENDIQMLDSHNLLDADIAKENYGADASGGKIFGAKGNELKVIAEKVQLSQAVRVSTVDNYQGEESKIVIISLVRSPGEPRQSGTIGFLKSSNRMNVLLSRAIHGMYLVGNSELLKAKSPIWAKVIDLNIKNDTIGPGLPIFCVRHPDETHIIERGHQFKQVAPDGGCSRPCQIKLPDCGHICPLRCHSDYEGHRDVEMIVASAQRFLKMSFIQNAGIC
ncbi:hypothetical protein HDU97_004095 [Phlyctochytrium planicorne]|nr:hypothetical protein HDU97_004095 [Phlyctochytrium planicorne]